MKVPGNDTENAALVTFNAHKIRAAALMAFKPFIETNGFKNGSLRV